VREKKLQFPVTANLSGEQKEFLIRWAYVHGMSRSEAIRHALWLLSGKKND
jgi:hypothetical protein